MNRITDITKLTAITKVFFGGLLKLATDYISKVISDGGTVSSKTATNDIYKSLPEQDSIQFAWIGGAGSKKRTSTIWDYFTKLYDMFYGQIEVTGTELSNNLNPQQLPGNTITLIDSVITATSEGGGSTTRPKLDFLVANGFVIGQSYHIKISEQNIISGVPKFRLYNGSSYIIDEDLDNQDVYFTMEAGTAFIAFDASTAWSFTAIISVKEVTSIPNDATQTTESLQPYVSGNIAPNENEGLKNVNGDGRYMEHNEISFTANEAWSLTTCFNFNSSSRSNITILGERIISRLDIRVSDENTIHYRNSDNVRTILVANSNYISGKNVVFTLVADGSNNLSLYINGVFIITATSFSTISKFSGIIRGYINGGREFEGIFNSYIIHSKALTAAQVTEVYDILSPLYPEIPSVEIGTQTWATSNFEAVATPMGTVIPEMQEGSNVEKITNGGFDTDSNWVKGDGWSISGGTANCDGTQGGSSAIYQTSLLGATEGFVKVTYTISNYSAGAIQSFAFGGSGHGTLRSANGTYIEYLNYEDTNANFGLTANSLFVGSIDNVSFEQVGWAGSQDLYDGLIAQGESVYDATKAAAMWCYFDNDLATGAIYGKLYNWFAVSLLQQDIDLYNASNPDWGWHVPTSAEVGTVITSLGGYAVAGGKMKMTGLDYWDSPNTGADNSSGFTCLGGGTRVGNSNFVDIKNQSRIATISGNGTNVSYFRLYSNSSELEEVLVSKRTGFSLRLLKD